MNATTACYSIARAVPIARVVSVNTHEEVRQYVASLAETEAFKRSARERRKVEMLFAHLKRHLNFAVCVCAA